MLKEFGLHAPGVSREVASTFDFETRCVTSLYSRCFKNQQRIKKIWKVLVEIVPIIDDPRPRDLLGALTIQVRGSVLQFFELEPQAKKEQTLEYLMEGIRKLATAEDWEVAEFEAAERQVRDCKFINAWTWKSPVRNPATTMTAEVFIEHEISEARLSIRCRDKKRSVVKQELLVSEKPHELIFYKHLGKLQWLDDRTVRLFSRNGCEYFTVEC
jgi:hypothetical protein